MVPPSSCLEENEELGEHWCKDNQVLAFSHLVLPRADKGITELRTRSLSSFVKPSSVFFLMRKELFQC